MLIKLESSFVADFKMLTLAELKIAYNMGIVSIDAFINKAMANTELGNYSEDELELSALSSQNTFCILEKVDKIIIAKTSEQESDCDKLMCICLYWVYKNKDTIENLNTIIDAIVSDFGYPDFARELTVGYFGGGEHLKEFLNGCKFSYIFNL